VRAVLARSHLLFAVIVFGIRIRFLRGFCGRVRFCRRPGLPVPVIPRVVVISAPVVVLLLLLLRLLPGLLLMRLFSHRYQISYGPGTKKNLLCPDCYCPEKSVPSWTSMINAPSSSTTLSRSGPANNGRLDIFEFT